MCVHLYLFWVLYVYVLFLMMRTRELDTYQLNSVDVDETYQPLPEIPMIDAVAQIPGSWATATKLTAQIKNKCQQIYGCINRAKQHCVKLNRKQNYLFQLDFKSLNILFNSHVRVTKGTAFGVGNTHTHTSQIYKLIRELRCKHFCGSNVNTINWQIDLHINVCDRSRCVRYSEDVSFFL